MVELLIITFDGSAIGCVAAPASNQNVGKTPAGTLLVVETAELRSTVLPGQTAARLFAVICGDGKPNGVAQLAEPIVMYLTDESGITVAVMPATVTVVPE
ncbi:hypothetical protein D3C72_418690 [compost metagenome]